MTLVAKCLTCGTPLGSDPECRVCATRLPCSSYHSLAIGSKCQNCGFLKEQHQREPAEETVNHPAHYGGADDPYECIKVVEALGLGFHLANVFKYIWRVGKKGDDVENLKKALWYLERYIQVVSKTFAARTTPAKTYEEFRDAASVYLTALLKQGDLLRWKIERGSDPSMCEAVCTTPALTTQQQRELLIHCGFKFDRAPILFLPWEGNS